MKRVQSLSAKRIKPVSTLDLFLQGLLIGSAKGSTPAEFIHTNRATNKHGRPKTHEFATSDESTFFFTK